MKITKISYDFQLLTRIVDNESRVPMGPGLFMNEMAEKLDFSYERLYRIHFKPPEVHQLYEYGTDEGRQIKSLTGYDQLVAVQEFSNVKQFMYFIDTGTDGIPVATKFSDENWIVTTPIFENQKLLVKLSHHQLNGLLSSLVNRDAWND